MENYQKIRHLFTRAESKFLNALEEAISNEYRAYGKIRIADAIKPNYAERTSEWHTYFNKIKAKHFDFILCDKNTNEILCAIELNDRSHLQKKRVERDEFIRKVCEEIKLPLIFFETRYEYNWREIQRIIHGRINRSESKNEFGNIKLEKDRVFYKKEKWKMNSNYTTGVVLGVILMFLMLSTLNNLAKCTHSLSEQAKTRETRPLIQWPKIEAPIFKTEVLPLKDKNKINCWQDETGKKTYSNVEPINQKLVPCD